jgi:uncharacterized protein
MTTERFEMRIDSGLLDRLDNWRSGEEDAPSRAEAVRRLLEAGLANDNKGKPPSLSDGEKLIALMVGDLIKGLGVKSDMNISLVENVIYGGHYWALGWEMPGIFHGHADKQSRVRFVVDVLDMWSFLEEAFEELSDDDRAKLAAEVEPFGQCVRFPGFDGNNEGEYLSIATFLVKDLQRFSRFRKEDLDLNSHFATIGNYGRMFRSFEPIREKLIGRRMNVDEMAIVINARRAGNAETEVRMQAD